MPADRPALLDQHATPATALRRVGGIDGDYPATGACCRVRQDGEERAPPRVTNRLGQMMMLHHGGGLEVLVIDRVVLLNELEGYLMVGVLPLSPHLLMRLGQQGHRFASAMTPTFPPSDPPLGCLEGALRFAIPARMKDAGPVRERSERLYP